MIVPDSSFLNEPLQLTGSSRNDRSPDCSQQPVCKVGLSQLFRSIPYRYMESKSSFFLAFAVFSESGDIKRSLTLRKLYRLRLHSVYRLQTAVSHSQSSMPEFQASRHNIRRPQLSPSALHFSFREGRISLRFV